MTAPEPTTAELVRDARLQAAWLEQKYQGLDGTPILLTALADRLAALAPLEPLGRLVEAMEGLLDARLSLVQPFRGHWFAELRADEAPFATTSVEGSAAEALAALADALEREAREGQ